MKWQRKQANPAKSILFEVEKTHNDQITKDKPTTNVTEQRNTLTQKRIVGLGDQRASNPRYAT